MRPIAICLVLATLLAALAPGCGGNDPPSSQPSDPAGELSNHASGGQRDGGGGGPAAPAADPTPCPADLAECRSASGRIVYVEAVDPDGDGDAHFVLVSREGITAPGITVVDVRADLRPNPLPRVGDSLSAAGPVYTGSYGQRQIEAVAIHFARAR